MQLQRLIERRKSTCGALGSFAIVMPLRGGRAAISPGGGMADARDLKSLDRKVMRVRLPPRAQASVQMGRGDDVPTCFHWDPSSCAMPFPLLCLAVPLITMKHEDEEGDLRKKIFLQVLYNNAGSGRVSRRRRSHPWMLSKKPTQKRRQCMI